MNRAITLVRPLGGSLRPLSFAVALVVVLVAALILLNLAARSTPLTLQEQVGDATIAFQGSSNQLLFPGQCLVVQWAVEGIQAVKFNNRGQVGSGAQEFCAIGRLPALEVKLIDDSTQRFRLPVELLYQQPAVLLLLVALVVGLAVIAYQLLGGVGLVVVVTLLVMWPLVRSELSTGGNMIDHVTFAQRAFDAGNPALLPPHFLLHGVMIGLHTLLPALNLTNAAFIALLAAYVGSSAVTYGMLRWLAGRDRSDLLLAAVTISLLFIGPLAAVSHTLRPDSRYALLHPNLFHSPTLVMLRPFALLLFWLVLRLLRHSSWRLAVVAGIVAVFATLAKPSYTIALFPGLGLLLLLRFLATRQLLRDALLATVFVGGGLTLLWQYAFLSNPQPTGQFTMGSATNDYQILMAPFTLLTVYWQVPFGWVWIDLLLSLAFPIAVYSAYFRDADRPVLDLAWLVTLAGVAYMYLLIETPGDTNGNLTWSAHITTLILFTTSAGVLLRQRWDWRWGLCAALFGLHLLNGLVTRL